VSVLVQIKAGIKKEKKIKFLQLLYQTNGENIIKIEKRKKIEKTE